ncbi:hypothetical protein QP868_03895 [Brevibacterium sp. UMB1308A]|uniref:hypothetical protein n=1 Tax=Brevibacterium sp. UMB1308A TaxID=3050608 RepID=UPI0025509633|nr:hypothetical protein [Brevibacterium sp. UMB1308A]MDK8346032.1 hypothetical protein [Brevibacterium sp. UMB1308B]MDK8713035.1 hypothetical protein [Brevibacterium sp. UMB1308A]
MTYTSAHVLIADAHTEPTDVFTLIRNVRPRIEVNTDTGRVQLSRHSHLEGPIALTEQDCAQLECERDSVVFALWGPTDRESTPPVGDGPLDAFFPHGLPIKEEERNIELLLALARRLHGSVRLAGDTSAPRTVTPDPDQHAVYTVFSSYWLDPALCADTVRQVMPEVQSHEQFTLDASTIAADEPILLDGYSVTATLAAGPDYPAEVVVLVEDHLPPAVDQYAQAPLISYLVRWVAPGSVGDPDVAPHVRAQVVRELERIAGALMRATAGIGIDADGFLVTESQLSGT